MSSASVRTILPLAVITCTAMLSMDLYLPAIPALQRGLDLTVPQGQATVAVFLVGLAGSQLLWGEALQRIGPRRCVRVGLWGLAASSFGCALAPGIGSLLAMRLLQGVAAGASTVVSPSVIRATLPDRDGVRGIAAISMIEAIVPAAGPVLGTLLLLVADWRWIFVIVGAVALLSLPFALRATPPALPHVDHALRTGYLVLLGNGRFVRLALSHALTFAALITFVASAPQVLQAALGLEPAAFAVTQVCGVSAFIVAASQSGRVSARMGPMGAVRAGAWVHAVLCAGLLLGWALAGVSFPGVLAFWVAFCSTLGIRGPAAFSEALAVPAAQMGRASALMVLSLLIAGAVGTQAAAPLLAGWGMGGVALVMSVLAAASLALVARQPAERPRHDATVP